MKLARIQNAIILLTIILFCVAILSPSHARAAFSFKRSLTVGVSGPDVLELQKILNQSSDTQISTYGAGSPGNETTYFGSLTAAAVARFQEKYGAQILVPNSLSAGTGYVGASTLGVLNSLEIQISLVPAATSLVSVKTPVSAPVVASTPAPVQSSSQTTAYPAPISSTTNPNNLKHLDTLLADIQKVGVKQGLSQSQLQQAREAALTAVATSTDLQQAFIDAAEKSSTVAVNVFPRSTFGNVLNSFLAGVGNFVKPQPVFAQSGTPFGGSLVSTLYCTQTGNWYVDITPLAPSYAVLLTYEIGTQMYMMFDLPFALNLLGSYTGGSPCIEGECPYCVTLPSEGQISGNTGSS